MDRAVRGGAGGVETKICRLDPLRLDLGQRLQMDNPEPPAQIDSEEELEAMSQELKLRQLCQDIAAQIMVDELEDEEK